MFGVNYAPILYWHLHYLQMDQNKIPHDPRHLGVASGAYKTIFVAVERSTQTVHLLASRLALSLNGLNRASSWASSPRSTIGCVQHVFWAYGPFIAYHAPNCIKISTISNSTISSFHLSLVTYAYHRVHLKWFLSLRYVWRKPCTNLSPTLTLSPSGPKRNSTWSTSPSCSIQCVQNDFWASSTFDAKLCTYPASWLALSPNELNRASTWASSPWSTTKCVQNDLWAYGMFGANCAPILH
jgi:hypothetical protein